MHFLLRTFLVFFNQTTTTTVVLSVFIAVQRQARFKPFFAFHLSFIHTAPIPLPAFSYFSATMYVVHTCCMFIILILKYYSFFLYSQQLFCVFISCFWFFRHSTKQKTVQCLYWCTQQARKVQDIFRVPPFVYPHSTYPSSAILCSTGSIRQDK